ncbi:hypothetical protein FGO68_gene13950 [Halteria grandinella]|uniref:Uncharacterized protein n=1 Tax=Halteria grandinella TaxID=5974 RepID=A0A8J8NMY7_HALGN|nr:hypothetical protein FGO68_gene13950 [Halteria grandinella]
MQSTSERRLAQNAYNILKQKGPEILVQRLILSFRIMKQGVDCPYFKQYPDILKDDKLNHSLTLRYQKSLMTTIQSLTPQQRQKPTFLIKAFYDNLNLVNLFPLLENDFDVELGGDNWRKFIGSYKTFATPQKVIVPSFEVLNRLFDPGMISQSEKQRAFEEEKSEDAVVRAFFQESNGRKDGSVGGPQNLVVSDVEAHNRYLAQIETKDQFYSKQQVERTFVNLLTDQTGQASSLINQKMHDLLNPQEAKKEQQLMRQDIDTYNKVLAEKIDLLKNRFNDFYLAVHPRRKDDQQRLELIKANSVRGLSDTHRIMPNLVNSASRVVEESNQNDIDYLELDFDLREQENNSDLE